MKLTLILSILLVGAFCADVKVQLMKDLFQQWKVQHNKQYAFGLEEAVRFEIFAQNYLDILEFNAQGDSATLALNQFADLTSDEFGALYTGAIFPETTENQVSFDYIKDLPASFDWRALGAVTDVKNQGQCGSCWAFSSTGSLEGLNYINSSTLVSFSEQQLVDCVTVDQGCNGGEMTDALEYVSQTGIEAEDEYPYTGEDGKCNLIPSKVYNVSTGYVNVTIQSTDALKAAIVQQPVSVGIQANQLVFQFYAGGVIKKFCGDNLDHGVLAVGYDTVNGVEAFIVKNSWGGSWGDSGYVHIATDSTPNKGNGVCGILAQPLVPVNNS